MNMNEQNEKSSEQMKKQLRMKMLALRDALPEEKRREMSLLIQRNILAHPAYKETEQVLSYVNFRSEVSTEEILKQALYDKKELYCPKVCGKEMEFYRIYDLTDLKPGAYGILEPVAYEERKYVLCPEKKALMLVPGAAFDERGFRLGYGGGYYDRFLAGIFQRNASLSGAQERSLFTTAALLFSNQMVASLVKEPHDFAVDFLVTEEKHERLQERA